MDHAFSTGSMVGMERKAADVYPFLEAYIERRESQITEIQQVIDRYQRKRLKEDQVYHTMSPLRRMFAGKKPDHHLAVEHIHYVKKPMEQIRKLQREISRAKELMDNTKPGDSILIPDEIENEIN